MSAPYSAVQLPEPSADVFRGGNGRIGTELSGTRKDMKNKLPEKKILQLLIPYQIEILISKFSVLYSSMTHDVFISYAYEDKLIADAICAKLEQNQVRCWIAPRDIAPGEKLAGAIVSAIDRSNLIVVVFSRRADESNIVRNEIERAFTHEKIIIPFRIEDVQPSDELQYFIGSRHWLDAITPPLEEHLNRLLDSVSRIIREKGPSVREGSPLSPVATASPGSEERFPHARGSYRIIAYLIDNTIIFLGFWVLAFFITNSLKDIFFQIYVIMVFFVWPLLYIIYFIFWEMSGFMGTPGKQVLGLRVINEEGGKISFRGCLIRTLTKCFTFSLAGITLLFNPSRRAIYDNWAGTLVVRKDQSNR
jgi:uncharacterized RDD family membrane protein YckC